MDYTATNSIRVAWRAQNPDFVDDPERQPWLHASPLVFPNVAAALGLVLYEVPPPARVRRRAAEDCPRRGAACRERAAQAVSGVSNWG